jgi:hypothetical protein
MQLSFNDLAGLGISPYDGVILAWLPKLESVMQEMRRNTPDGEEILYLQDGTAIDMLRAKAVGGQLQSARWWQVREAARSARVPLVSPIFSCAAMDLRMPEVPRPAEHKLYLRRYDKGPWIALEKPILLESEKEVEQA